MVFILIKITYTDDIQAVTSFLFGFKQTDTSFILVSLKMNKVGDKTFLLCQGPFILLQSINKGRIRY